jgi:hypothetical protein
MPKWKPKRPRPKVEPPQQKTGPHPWRKYFNGVPMPTDHGIAQMNWTVEQADAIALHCELIGMTLDPEASKIKQVAPANGPVGWFNPGPWVDIDAPDTAPAETQTPDLTPLSDEQVALIEQEHKAMDAALRQRRIDQILAAGADPNVQADMATETGTGTPETGTQPTESEQE